MAEKSIGQPIEDIDVRLKHPLNCIVCGATSSGKTTTLLRILKSPSYVIANLPENYSIYYIHGPYFQKEFSDFPNINFFQGWDHPELDVSEMRKKSLILILDDVYQDTCPKFLQKCFTQYGNHYNWSVFLLTHFLYTGSIKSFRELNLNSQAHLFTYSPQARSMIKTYGYQYFGKDAKRFEEAYDNVLLDQSYAYLLVDHGLHCPSQYRLRTRITEEEKPMLIILPNQDNENSPGK